MGKPKVDFLKVTKAATGKKERTALVAKPTRKLTKLELKNVKKEDLIACKVLGLENINELARKYRGKLNLTLTAATNKSKDSPLDQRLINWETELNKICILDPVIAVENFIDDEGPPQDFTYVRENIQNEETKSLMDPSFLVGCDCYPRCSHTNCSCPKNSGGHFAYDRSKRILLPPRSPVYECNRNCKCSIDCPNRVIQKGLTARVCIFRTHDGRGWGLKSREFIPKHKFVVEYVGEVITSDEAERRGTIYDAIQQTYLFDLDFHDEDATFTVDASRYGNVSHFINHSCDPNLLVYSVWVDSLDPRLPRIGLFAVRDIQPGEELTFDYMMTCTSNDVSVTSPISNRSPNKPTKKSRMNQQSPPSSKKRVYCACGAKTCRKYLF